MGPLLRVVGNKAVGQGTIASGILRTFSGLDPGLVLPQSSFGSCALLILTPEGMPATLAHIQLAQRAKGCLGRVPLTYFATTRPGTKSLSEGVVAAWTFQRRILVG